MAVDGINKMEAAAEIGRNPVSKFSMSIENEQADPGRDGRTRLLTKFSGVNGNREMFKEKYERI